MKLPSSLPLLTGVFLAWLHGHACAAETLYNGIVLPDTWPPKREQEAVKAREPMDVPWLKPGVRPEVIPIEIGRQLFVDDFLIERTTLKRTLHQARYHVASPVLQPTEEWEKKGEPTAMVFSDGVWHDPKDGLFKMWYMGGYIASTCMATSKDGIHWEKKPFDVKPGTNIVQPETRDSATVWLDNAESDPARRFKLWRAHSLGKNWGLTMHVSPDGIHWSDPVLDTGSIGDRSTVFYNPFRKVWVYSLRHGWGQPRMRRYFETPNLINGPKWEAIGEPAMWTGADVNDTMREDLKTPPELYNLDAVAYESVLLGLFSIWRGQPEDRPKPNEVCVGFSRDGFHWHRPEYKALIPVSEKKGDWNWGNVQSAGGCCLVVGDELWFYVSGRAGVEGGKKSGVSSTGLAVLRRDGFASMDAPANGDEGELTTRPLKFQGKHLFANAKVDSS
ncbi:MAG TPA: hypothetical protein VLE43_20785 [Candidatus Saccharimonadia bacterium]|nr:hypothetical protein [Candidatus Saccharimonadia bacterium]